MKKYYSYPLKRRNKILLCAIILAIFATTLLFGCSERKIESIAIEPNSFATDYKVDAPLDLLGAYIKLRYTNGTPERVEITRDMVSGFDTATTGEKTLTVTYKNLTASHTYRVYNPENASKEVVTHARLSVSAYEPNDGEYIEYTVRLDMAELTAVSAVSFTVTSAETLGITANKYNLSVSSEGSNASYASYLSENGKELKMVIFEKNGDALFGKDGGTVAKIRINGGHNRSVLLKTITLSDGNRNYYLPIAQ